MKIKLCSVFVDDQSKALAFYTNTLGFQLKHDIPLGKFRWLTVVAKDEPDGAELLLEPNENPAAKTYQAAIKAQGIPAAAFMVEDITAEYARLKNLGVHFTLPPTKIPNNGTTATTTIATLDDTCGNLLQLYQPAKD